MKKKVLLAMSGGIDSSIAAYLLLEQGYEVVGVTLRVWDYIDEKCTNKKGCCSLEDIYDAKEVANRFKIEHHVLDVREEFKKIIVKDFIDEYLNGRTPNPCVKCNFYFKWDYLMDKMQGYDCEYIATGHYAKINKIDNDLFIALATDTNKDQSYFLWQLEQKHLQKTIFPLGNLNKTEIKKIAEHLLLDFLNKKKESQDICFVQNNSYREFLTANVDNIGEKYPEGNFLNISGEVLGKHNGIPFYTIGQRKGLGIAFTEPLYVKKINLDDNSIILTTKKDLFTDIMYVENHNFISFEKFTNKKLLVKIRYRNKGQMCTISLNNEQQLEVKFDKKIEAVTPGQSAVFYDNENLIGGGFILS